jgi:subtilisin family serine protease
MKSFRSRRIFCAILASVAVLWAAEGLFGRHIAVDANLAAFWEPAGRGSGGYVANEIIVKFRSSAAAVVEKSAAKGKSGFELEVSESLRGLNRRYGLKRCEGVFKNFKENRGRVRALLKKDEALLSKKERHLVRRLKRAGKGAEVPALDRIYRLEFEPGEGQRLEDVVAAYNSDPEVEYAELNYIVSIDAVPDDPLYPLQWSLNNTGQMYPASGKYKLPPGTPDADIDAPEAWDIETGDSEIIVAVVDTGVDYDHRDLAGNIWVNELELSGEAGVDDDENGYVDDVYGYNFLEGSGDVRDDHGHGTHVSGTIAAEGDNGLDVAGVCWDLRIMGLKFLDSSGGGDSLDAAVAFYYAVENGADVISNSWGGGGYLHTVQQAINYAYNQGVILVASAGNNGSSSPQYPGAYERMISVAATNSDDGKASFSNFGEWIDIAAPGVDILSLRGSGTALGTVYDEYTTVLSGTSMACPYVSGACAFLLSLNPGLSAAEVYDILIGSVDPIADGICLSDGRLNVYEMIFGAVGSRGRVDFDRDYYRCSDVILIMVGDGDLAGGGGQEVTVTTDGGDLETVVLAEGSAPIGFFTGTILTGAGEVSSEDGVVQLADGDVITVTYEDADDGSGSGALAADSAAADCAGPEVFDLWVDVPGPEPKVVFETSEAATAHVRAGLSCGGPYIIRSGVMRPGTSHRIKLSGVSASTEYFFEIEVRDAAGNAVVDANGGDCYRFTTDGPGDVCVPGDDPNFRLTIQEGIERSWDGGTVWVADRTYRGEGNRDIDFGGKAITVRSENGPAKCIIDCQNTTWEWHRGFDFHSGEDGNSVVMGFTVRSSTGQGSSPAGFGGGIRCVGSSPTVRDCVFRGDISNGMLNIEGSSPTVVNCTFRGSRHPGMRNEGSSPRVMWCSFVDNLAVENVGGGGMANFNSEPVVMGCRFEGNRAVTYGGGMYNVGSSGTVISCVFLGNHAGTVDANDKGYGGGMSNIESSPDVINCVFSGNGASGDGGGMSNEYDSRLAVINCTFGGNRAGSDEPNGAGFGGGMANINGGEARVRNCILWQNRDSDGEGESGQICGWRSDVNYSCVQNWSGGGIGNISTEPVFFDAGYWEDNGTAGDLSDDFWVEGNYYLSPSISPCIDAGDNEAVLGLAETGVDGWPRFVDDPCVPDTGNGSGAIVDIGAYEYQGPRDIYVDDDAAGDPGPGDSEVSDPEENGTEAHPFDMIQEAIDVALDGDTVVVGMGTYYESIDFKGKRITVRSVAPGDSAVVAGTVIDGGDSGRVVTFASGEGPETVLSGFTIFGGEVGIYCYGSSPVISNCVVRDGEGIGIEIWHGGDPTITDCEVEGEIKVYPVVENLRTGDWYDYIQDAIDEAAAGDEIVAGEGVYYEAIDFRGKDITLRSTEPSDPEVMRATFIIHDVNDFKSAVTFSGGESGAAVLSGFTIVGFSSAVSCYEAFPTISNCRIIGIEGVAIDLWRGSSPELVNCTVIGEIRIHPAVKNLRTGKLYDFIQDAVDEAAAGDELVAGRGRYYDQSVRIESKDLVVRSEEPNDPWVVRDTIIEGEVEIVWFSEGEPNGVVLSGFTIGGIRCSDTSPTIINCVVSGGYVGLYLYDSYPRLLKCFISGADYAIILACCSKPELIDCTVEGEIWVGTVENLTSGRKYYIYIQTAINEAEDGDVIVAGEGAYRENINFNRKNIVVRSSAPEDPEVVAGTVIDGGGKGATVSFHKPVEPEAVLSGFTITGGWSQGNGGGISCMGSDVRATISNCIIVGNLDSGVYFEKSLATVTNCLIAGNGGAGVKALGRVVGTVRNCTVAENRGAGVRALKGIPTVINSIIWGNGGEGISGAKSRVSYSNVEGGYAGEGNIESDPRFVRPGLWVDVNDGDVVLGPNDANAVWVRGDYRLMLGSPCIDGGTDANVYSDIEGVVRPFDYPGIDNNGELDEYDMGAYEAFMPSVEFEMKFTPQSLNARSQGKWLKAHFLLPEGFSADDIDTEAVGRLEPLGIGSSYIKVSVERRKPVGVMIGFRRGDFCVWGDYGPAEVMVVGLLRSDEYFYGRDTIKITDVGLKYLAGLASVWLRADCRAPHWCGGLDVDRDSMVDFVDFALYDTCCIEAVKK